MMSAKVAQEDDEETRPEPQTTIPTFQLCHWPISTIIACGMGNVNGFCGYFLQRDCHRAGPDARIRGGRAGQIDTREPRRYSRDVNDPKGIRSP